MNNNNVIKVGDLLQILDHMKSKLELNPTQQNAISKISTTGTGSKVLADNGEYTENYRTMTDLEISSLVTSVLS